MAKKEIVLIHGTWGHASNWDEMRTELEARGYTVHTPILRYHDLPVWEGALKLGTVRLLDYVNDLVDFVKTLDEPPIIGGVSMGGLLAQLVAARVENKGLLLLSPAPAWGMFPFYPSMLRTFYKHFLQWGFWRKPLYPHWEEFRWSVVNEQTEEKAKEFFYSLKLESGRAYMDMGFWFLDPQRSSWVDVDAITAPVLILGGAKDRVVAPRIARVTANRYKKNGKLVVLPDSDHVMMVGKELKNTMREFDQWVAENNIVPLTEELEKN